MQPAYRLSVFLIVSEFWEEHPLFGKCTKQDENNFIGALYWHIVEDDDLTYLSFTRRRKDEDNIVIMMPKMASIYCRAENIKVTK